MSEMRYRLIEVEAEKGQAARYGDGAFEEKLQDALLLSLLNRGLLTRNQFDLCAGELKKGGGAVGKAEKSGGILPRIDR